MAQLQIREKETPPRPSCDKAGQARRLILSGLIPQPIQKILVIRIQQVGVDLAGSGRGTMAQCLADIVHGDPFGAGNAGKAVAEAVKGQRRKMVLRDEARKEFRSVVRTHRLGQSQIPCKHHLRCE